MNGYKATILLIKYGFSLKASTVVRSIVESTFVFNGIMNNPDETLSKMEQLANYNKQKLKRNALRYEAQKDNAEKFDFSDLDAKKVTVFNLIELNPKKYGVVRNCLCIIV